MIINLLKVFLISSLPIVEIRGSLPLALTVYHLPYFLAFLFCFLGNIFPVFFLLILLEKIVNYLSRFHFFKKFFFWYFNRTDQNFKRHFEEWGKLALVIFVALPLPLTGAWTGSVAASLMRFNKKESFFLISLGVFLAGILVSLIFYSALFFVIS